MNINGNKPAAARIEANDTYLKINKVLSQITATTIAILGVRTMKIPNPVATILPLLNFRKSEKLCPNSYARLQRSP